MRVSWVTDPHLNFVQFPSQFGKKLVDDEPNAVLITGNISECHRLSRDLLSLREGIGENIPIWFLLGNHDAYLGSVTQAKRIANGMNNLASNLIYIGSENNKGIELAEDVWLIGVDGWYSATAGTPFESSAYITDFNLISEMIVATDNQRDITAGHVAAARRLASVEADLAKAKLAAVLRKKPKRIVFATHVPPYAQATFHKNTISDNNWLPWFSNTMTGSVLDTVAKNHPEVTFDVVCGHTHFSGLYRRSDNMTVFVGASQYVVPSVASIMEF